MTPLVEEYSRAFTRTHSPHQLPQLLHLTPRTPSSFTRSLAPHLMPCTHPIPPQTPACRLGPETTKNLHLTPDPIPLEASLLSTLTEPPRTSKETPKPPREPHSPERPRNPQSTQKNHSPASVHQTGFIVVPELPRDARNLLRSSQQLTAASRAAATSTCSSEPTGDRQHAPASSAGNRPHF